MGFWLLAGEDSLIPTPGSGGGTPAPVDVWTSDPYDLIDRSTWQYASS